MTERLSGPEMLLKNLLGISPTEMKATVAGMIAKVNEINAFMVEIRGRLDRLEKHLGVANVEPVSPFPALENDERKDAANVR